MPAIHILPAALLPGAALVLGLWIWRLRRINRRLASQLREERRAAEYFRMAAEHANDGLVVHSPDLTVLWANPAYLRMMGRSQAEVIGRTPLEFAFPEDETPEKVEIDAMLDGLRANPNEELRLFRNRRGDGTIFWNQINISIRRSEIGEVHAILVCRDVSESVAQAEHLRQIRDRLAHEASHDSLTGLANRGEVMRFIQGALDRPAGREGQVGILHIDLDKFKEINDTHGHSAGDATLEHAARQLRASVRRGDLVGRIGGDEFVVVCPGLPDLAALDRLAGGLSRAIARPFDWKGTALHCGASIGCTLSTPGADDPQTLLIQSDFALYEAKRAGRGRVAVYDEGLHQRHTRVLNRAADLRLALDNGGLEHFFQPIADIARGRIVSFETLVRWRHPEDGVISPAEFLPLAQELGLLAQVDFASMEAALRFKRRLSQAGHGAITVSFNASSELLRHPSFLNQLVFAAETAGMERRDIAIEVLETTVFADDSRQDSPARVIRDLRDAGFQVLLDDFGMGYAGLAHLSELAVTGIKLDKTLLRNLRENETNAKIVATISELCRDLGLRMVAEGVEDQETAERLRALGARQIQGYWLARPLPEDEALKFVADRAGLFPMPRRQRRSAGLPAA